MKKIVVAVKQVAVLDEEFELLDGAKGVDPDFIDWDLNEWDQFSLEAALQLREAEPEGECEVVVMTVGDGDTEESLVDCLAKVRIARSESGVIPLKEPMS